MPEPSKPNRVEQGMAELARLRANAVERRKEPAAAHLLASFKVNPDRFRPLVDSYLLANDSLRELVDHCARWYGTAPAVLRKQR